MENYTDLNAKIISKWAEDGWEWGVPISEENFAKARRGEWSLLLTPQIPVPRDWFLPYMKNGRLDGVSLLGLASGGGQQMPVFAALGADCTVLDYAEAQLESERQVAAREVFEINIVRADMTKILPFEDCSFDIIFHPVSNCYVEDVYHIWRECFRVLRHGGVLLAGMDNGVNYLFDYEDGLKIVNKLPFNPLKDPVLYQKSMEGDWGIQFSHTLEEQIGGQLAAGLVLTHLYEDRDNLPGIGEYFPQYIATRALKPH